MDWRITGEINKSDLNESILRAFTEVVFVVSRMHTPRRLQIVGTSFVEQLIRCLRENIELQSATTINPIEN